MAPATAIDFGTAIDSSTLKSIAVATAIDFSTLKSIAVATAIDSDSGHGIRSTRLGARGLGGLPLEKDTGLHIVVRAWASTSWCVLGSQGLSCFFHQKRPKHNVFPKPPTPPPRHAIVNSKIWQNTRKKVVASRQLLVFTSAPSNRRKRGSFFLMEAFSKKGGISVATIIH